MAGCQLSESTGTRGCILLATTGYPPAYSGSGTRLHAQYRRLARRHSALSWRVVTKSAGGVTAEHPCGPEFVADFAARHPTKKAGAAVIFSELRWIQSLVGSGVLDNVAMVHCAGWSWYTLLLCRAARRRNIPVLREMTSVGDSGAAGWIGRYFIQWTNRLAQRFVSISPKLEQDLRQTGITKPVWVRPNGIDTATFRPPSDAERHSARADLRPLFTNFRADDRLIVHLGRIRPLKNQQFLVRCVKGLPDNYKLLLAGPAYGRTDPYFVELQNLLERDGVAGRVVMLEGFHKDVRPFYWAADVLAFPSTNEGLGNVMLEALCCGVPVAAHNISGVTDWIVEPGSNGALSALDLESFGNALRETQGLSRGEPIAAPAHERFGQDQLDAEFLNLVKEISRSR